MATTKLSDLINPQVMGDMIEAKIEAQCKLTPYAHVDTTLQGTAGDTKTVPSWNYIGDAEDFDVETASNTDAEVSTTKLTAGFRTFTIKCAMKAVSILQTAINSGLGDPVGQANLQLAKSIVNKVDNDVLGAIYDAESDAQYPCMTSGDGTDTINYDGIVDAVTLFEDEEDDIEKVMFVHPEQVAELLKDPDFLSADKFTAGVAVKGAIGQIAGCWIKKSKKVQKVTVEAETEGANDTYYWANPIIKCEPDSADTEYTEDELPAVTIFLKKDTQVDHEWFPKKQRHDITASKYYGVAVTNASKVVIAKFKATPRA